MPHRKRQYISIRIKLILQILLFVIPIVLGLLVSSLLAIHIITDRTKNLSANTLGLFMKNTKSSLENVDQCLYRLMVYDCDIEDMRFNQNDNKNWLSVMSLNHTLNDDLALLSFVEGIYVYVKPRDILANIKNSYYYYQDQDVIRQYVRENHQKQNFEKASYNRTYWQLARIGGVDYLTVNISSADVSIGSYISVDGYLWQLRKYTEDQFDYLYFLDPQGTIWGNEQPENMEDYLEVAVLDVSEQYTLVGLVKRNAIMAGIMKWQTWILAATIAVAVCLVAFMLRYITREVIRPVGYFTWAMRKVQEGNLSARLHLKSHFQEFADMAECFNGMVERIGELKISVYEEKIQKQQAQLLFLQLQSSPHYYLNSINILYSLTLKKDWELLKKMILILSKHSQYLLKNADAQVCLRDELEHVSNYILIQRQRFSYPVNCRVEAPEELMDCLIPVLLIQTFVENSCKYGISAGRTLDMVVVVKQTERKGKPMLFLSVRDFGKGFDEKVLLKVQSGERIIDDFGAEHYGIENIRQRLNLIYGADHTFTIKNNEEGGAEIQVEIPGKRG